jgi:hypothetical protein
MKMAVWIIVAHWNIAGTPALLFDPRTSAYYSEDLCKEDVAAWQQNSVPWHECIEVNLDAERPHRIPDGQ